MPEFEPEVNDASESSPAPRKASRRRQAGDRCRWLRVDGLQCRRPAVAGKPLCYHHLHHQETMPPSTAGGIEVPLLEDHASIQLLLTRVTLQVLSGRIAADVGRTIGYLCQVAASTLARPVAPRTKPTEEKLPVEEPATEITREADGQVLGPAKRYVGPEGEFKPSWSFSKYMYEMECERLQKEIPTCGEEFPESGWLTEEEMQEAGEDFRDRYLERLRKLRIRAGEATVEDLEAELTAARTARDKEEQERTRHWTLRACAGSRRRGRKQPGRKQPEVEQPGEHRPAIKRSAEHRSAKSRSAKNRSAG